ncbi:MAG: hypothetical protein ACOC3I_01400 [Verrucomicrobiota bacterium]
MALFRKTALGRPGADGFALIMALGLMALVVLLVVSLGTLGRVETRFAETRREQALARQHALYALGLALGQLQDAAGPDQRATARREILGAGVDDPFWTGVWNGAAAPRWLVTEDAGTGRLALGPRTLLVGPGRVGAGNEGHFVEVPTLPIESDNAAGQRVVRARIAWWTGDEGVKASIHAVDLVDRAVSPRAAQGLRQRGHHGVAWREWWGAAHPLRDEPATTWPALLRAVQLRAWLGDEDRARLLRHGHDLTLLATGLLTNAREGGLKENLTRFGAPSGPVARADVFATGQALAAWRGYPEISPAGSVPPVPLSLVEFEALEEGAPYVHVFPVVSEAAAYFAVFHHGQREGPAVRYAVEVELWNPYTVDLALVQGADRRAFTLNLSGLPALRVENLTSGTATELFAIDAMERSAGGTQTATWLELGEATGRGSSGDFALRAGEIYQLQDPDPGLQARGLVKYSGHRLPVEETHDVLLVGRAPGGGGGGEAVFELFAGAAPDFALDDPLFRVSGVPYDDFEFLYPARLSTSDPPYLINSTEVNVAGIYTMAFHYRLGGQGDWQSDADWLRGFDFRRPGLAADTRWLGRDGQRRGASAFLRPASRHPVALRNRLSGVFAGTDTLFDRVERDQTWEASGDVRLYDLPQGEPLSVADFRLLPFKGLPPLVLGSDYLPAVELNTAFDHYFLSTAFPGWSAPASEADWLSGLPNTRLSLLRNAAGELPSADDLLGAGAAAHLVLRGAFNWNSTSVRAWYASLVQGFGEEAPWRYTGPAGQGREVVAGAAFFRHPVGATHRQEPLDDAAMATHAPGSEAARFAAFRQGVRLLRRGEGAIEERAAERETDRLHALAAAIVEGLQARGRPFSSLSEFLNSGLLQDAIAASGINEHFPTYANGHLLQSDLVAALGLAPAVRSDTFIIRAMGEVVNPVTGEAGARAWGEAVVQRTLKGLEGEAPGEVGTGPRRFELIAFRWLDPSRDL